MMIMKNFNKTPQLTTLAFYCFSVEATVRTVYEIQSIHRIMLKFKNKQSSNFNKTPQSHVGVTLWPVSFYRAVLSFILSQPARVLTLCYQSGTWKATKNAIYGFIWPSWHDWFLPRLPRLMADKEFSLRLYKPSCLWVFKGKKKK